MAAENHRAAICEMPTTQKARESKPANQRAPKSLLKKIDSLSSSPDDKRRILVSEITNISRFPSKEACSDSKLSKHNEMNKLNIHSKKSQTDSAIVPNNLPERKIAVRSLPPEEKKAYFAQKKRESDARILADKTTKTARSISKSTSNQKYYDSIKNAPDKYDHLKDQWTANKQKERAQKAARPPSSKVSSQPKKLSLV